MTQPFLRTIHIISSSPPTSIYENVYIGAGGTTYTRHASHLPYKRIVYTATLHAVADINLL
jgi:hypothetical protein